MNQTDKTQQLTINLLIAGVTVISALVGIMAYRNNKRHQKIQEEIFSIDKEIKILDLMDKRNRMEKNGMI